ncbi:MAG: acetate--CoA ligase family protein [Acidimicrobiales bacterium]
MSGDGDLPLRAFLRPGRIAVVGASRERNSVGGILFANLLEGRFEGVVYPVNPTAEAIAGVVAYPSLRACPEPPDLAIVAIPADGVADVVGEAGELGVGAVCVISAGFAETGPEGRRRQQELMETAAASGVRLIGPNCMGVLNGAADVRMNGTFSSPFPPPGEVAFVSQSGATGLSVLAEAERRGLGMSAFVSVGNAADVTDADVVEHLGSDDDTRAILMYVESFGDPRRFLRQGRVIGREKPIVVLKAGRSEAGERAAASHTASVSSDEVTIEALFRQSGAIRVGTLPEMLDVARLLVLQPAPAGDGVAIVTNGGGPGILAADACSAEGLDVVELDERTVEGLQSFLAPDASTSNPVDVLAGADAETFRRAVESVAEDPGVATVIVIFIPPIVTRPDEVIAALHDAEMSDDVTLIGVFMSGPESRARLEAVGVPAFAHPEEAARALGGIVGWSRWCDRPAGRVVRPPGLQRDRATSIVRAALERNAHDGDADADADEREGVWLSADECESLLGSYGVPLARSRIVHGAEEAASAQRELDAPVAVKIDSPAHKSDIGGVRLGLETADETAEAVRSIHGQLTDTDADTGSFIVQEMIAGDVEIALGMNRNPRFGPVLMVGWGGSLLELVGDVSVRLTPVTDVDVDEMLGSLRVHRLLTGYRGEPAVDVDALTDVVHRVNALVEDVPELVEIDLNPVIASPSGVLCVDYRIRVTPSD